MSATGEAKAKKDALASGAKPRPEGRVRERGWRPTLELAHAEWVAEAARRRAIAGGRPVDASHRNASAEADA
jgi:hypothetical protein